MAAAANDVDDRNGKQRSTHAVAANIEQINHKMIRIDPMISESIPSQFTGLGSQAVSPEASGISSSDTGTGRT
jgi:hypothetical protein